MNCFNWFDFDWNNNNNNEYLVDKLINFSLNFIYLNKFEFDLMIEWIVLIDLILIEIIIMNI